MKILNKLGFYKGKSFRWAYYPPFLPYDTEALMKKKNGEKIRILFVGRMICWKNPNFVLRGVKSLLAAGYAVELTYIGNGPLLETLKNEAADVRDAVHFLGAMSPEQVRNHMEMSNILTFTSNSMEGWGAVLNEAMNAGCAVVTSASPGSAQTLLRDGENGLVYQGDSYEAFYQKLLQLVESPELTRKLGVAAYRTIADQYNAAVAAQRFCEQCKALLNEERIQDYAAGPMTRV